MAVDQFKTDRCVAAGADAIRITGAAHNRTSTVHELIERSLTGLAAPLGVELLATWERRFAEEVGSEQISTLALRTAEIVVFLAVGNSLDLDLRQAGSTDQLGRTLTGHTVELTIILTAPVNSRHAGP